MEINYYKPCPEYDRCCELIDRYWEAGEYEACFKRHLELAEQGYPLAECQVGWFYLKGQGQSAPQSMATGTRSIISERSTKRGSAPRAMQSRQNAGISLLPGRDRMRHLKNAALKGFHGNRLTHRRDSARRLPYRPAASEALHRKRTATDAYRLPLRKGRRLFCRFRLFCRRETCGIFRFPSWQ